MVCAGIVLVPDVLKPVTPAVAVAVQEKVALDGLAVKFTRVVAVPEQMVWLKLEFVITGD